ncbi:MAG: glycosyltransferase family A protein, partial [bacterium]|nr:glycosyltransferase family A protein [bacterium]
MKKPYLSIIIPAYKAEKSLPLLLDSIFATSGFSDFEILVMDDHSPDGTREIAQAYGSKIRYVSLKRNGGPAKARNEGARIAKGKILLFLDSDVVCFSDTVARVGKAFLNDPDLTALTGVWVRPKKTSRFFANYKALRDWSYWINERQVKGYYYLFSTRIAAVKRDVFLRLGGFNEAYKGADIEDIEFTYRIASRYAVLFDEKIRVKHEFEDFGPVAKKYFRRSFFWSQLFSERKKFDPVAMTISETITGLGAVLSLFFFLLSFVYHPFLFLAFFCLLLNLWGTRKFLIYTF